MRGGLVLGAVLWGALVVVVLACQSGEREQDAGAPIVRDEQQAEPKDQQQVRHDPLGPNAACYVCHMTFVREELTATHAAEDVGCIQCHGISEGHANDENIGATPPDKTFGRDQVNPFCRSCHETHDAAPEKVVARWTERRQQRADTQPIERAAACTDCHGEHTIAGG